MDVSREKYIAILEERLELMKQLQEKDAKILDLERQLFEKDKLLASQVIPQVSPEIPKKVVLEKPKTVEKPKSPPKSPKKVARKPPVIPVEEDEEDEESPPPSVKKTGQGLEKYGKLVPWTDVIRQSHPGSLSHLRKNQRLLIQEAFEEFLVKEVGKESASLCFLPTRDKKLEIALPEDLYDDFYEFLVVLVDDDLLGRTPKPLHKRLQPHISLVPEEDRRKSAPAALINLDTDEETDAEPTNKKRRISEKHREKKASPPPVPAKKAKTTKEEDIAPANPSGDESVEFGMWHDLVKTISPSFFEKTPKNEVEQMRAKVKQFLIDNVSKCGFELSDCHMPGLDSPDLDFWVPQPLWNDFLGFFESEILKGNNEVVKRPLLFAAPVNGVHDVDAKMVEEEELLHTNISKPKLEAPLKTPSGEPMTRYNYILRALMPEYNDQDKDARIEMKRRVRLYLTEKLGTDFQSIISTSNRDNKQHHTYCIPQSMEDNFKEWARTQLSELFPRK